jgi:polysaccharide export outer membrane protein
MRRWLTGQDFTLNQSDGGIMKFALSIKERIITPVAMILKSRSFGSKLLLTVSCGAVSLVALNSIGVVTAQQPDQQAANSRITPAIISPDDERYRIGPGDVLEVRVLRAPELSREAVRVDQRGMIRMPMIEDEIMAACLTEAELSHKIATLYLEYKRNPNVDVFVKDFQSQPVGIVGAVNNYRPEGTQFRLQRRVKLLELLMLAGGLSEKAGRTVNVVHTGGPGLCGNAESPQAGGDLATMATYKVNDTMRGVPEANPFLRPGDIVVVPEGDQVYVVGNVNRPLTIPLKETLTVSRAIAMAGGTGPSPKRSRVRIVRQVAGNSGKQEIFVDLNAIEKRNAIDVVLLPNDIVDVPTDGPKSFLKTLVGAVAPTVSNGAVRAIP